MKSIRLLVALALFGLAGFAAAEPTITGRTTIPVYDFFDLSITGAGTDDIIFWDLTEEGKAHVKEVGSTFLFTGPPGEYHLRVKIIPVKEGKISGKPYSLRSTLLIGEAPPTPAPGPIPPDPNPPGPAPGPAPIAGDGLRVMIVEDASKRTTLPAGQQNIITGRNFRDYLNSKTALGTDGKTHEWWILDKGTDTSDLDKRWQDAFIRTRASHPWIVISNGKTGYEGPLPATPDDAMNLVKKYAEAK